MVSDLRTKHHFVYSLRPPFGGLKFCQGTDYLPLTFIERYQISTIKEIASFAKGLQKDIEAVENAVASEKSNGFVEGTNSRLKMIKRTMYGRCSRQLLSAKLMYKKCCTT